MFQFDLKRNVSTGRGAIRNLKDGSSCASVKHYVNAARGIMGEDTECYDSAYEYFAHYSNNPKTSILINSRDYWLGKYKTGGMSLYYDTLVIDPTGTIWFYNTGDSSYENSNSQKAIFYTQRKRDSIVNAALIGGIDGLSNIINDTPKLEPIFIEGDEADGDEVESITITVIDTDGNIFHPSSATGKYGNWDSTGISFNNNTVIVKSENKSTGEVKMSNVKTTANAVIAANKSSAVNAAKIEAGTIVINRVVKLLKPKMPFGTSGMLDSPVGRVALANVVNILVEQYASNNPKAKVISGAVMDAAMLQMVQSFNIGQLVDDLISGVDISGFTEIKEVATDNTDIDLNKYAK